MERGQIYLNVGHTGLNEPTLSEWIERHALKPIYLVHDLIPLTHPQFCRAGEAERHARRMDTVLRTAFGVIGNSKATLDDLATYARDSGQPMPPSVAAWISGPPPSPPPRPSAPAEPYFVVLGTVEGRKNHRLLLDVWSRLLSRDDEDIPTLIVIGQRGWEASAEIEALCSPERYRGHVQFRETCGDAELASLLAGSRALLMPSYAEGFGLPVVEALQVGTPVIASNLPVFRELAGDIVQLIDPDRPDLWQAAILDYASDGGDRPAQLRRMKGYSAPDWPSHFAIVEDWIGKLGGEPSIRPFDRRRV
ncbi:glycosyltransferase family 1 protein [Sphingomonas sp. LY160]|uniref:glycosyltransferase family 4 protein n=1 Tax=Sphingomonas sp. LY160 TaxID=3095342 RepID=UPI002ADEF670|nr:glycosyltransferase family 1 protein [Sphingomonas sp. LY160]MEA1072009.1 glycosyltransferase family 1 protein [Sphingomonas sp. LY160]